MPRQSSCNDKSLLRLSIVAASFFVKGDLYECSNTRRKEIFNKP